MPPPKPDSHEAVRSADFFSASSRSEMALCIAVAQNAPCLSLIAPSIVNIISSEHRRPWGSLASERALKLALRTADVSYGYEG